MARRSGGRPSLSPAGGGSAKVTRGVELAVLVGRFRNEEEAFFKLVAFPGPLVFKIRIVDELAAINKRRSRVAT